MADFLGTSAHDVEWFPVLRLLKQADAAQILKVSRPRVSDVVNKKTAKFTIDTLVEMLSRVGKPVRLAIG
jgi:predicted XRE-type DNA-binding protein